MEYSVNTRRMEGCGLMPANKQRSQIKGLPNLVPYPRHLVGLPGRFRLSAAANVFASLDGAPACIRHKLQTLGLNPGAASGQPMSVVVGAPDLQGFRPPRQAEGYTLRCDPGGVAVCGADWDGLFWGLVTLEQLCGTAEAARATCPCVTIRDWPTFSFRYHHDDVSRKQVSTVDDFKRIIRLLSSYKVKYYTPYLEDMLYLKSYPDIGRGRGRLLPEEVRAILAEARLYNVTVFPTFSLIGHQENLLANPRYRKYGRAVFQPPSSFDPSLPALRPFLRKVIRDVCELFPDAPVFHAGFDETQGVPEADLIAHANWCAGELQRHGKRMLLWVDMFKNHFGLEALHKLSSNCVPVEWEYGDPRGMVPRYCKAGIAPVGLAGYNNWCCFLPDMRSGQKNIDQWIGVARRLHSAGFGASMWGDNGYENSRDLCWDLFAYYAEAAWTGNPQHGRAFELRFQASFYGRPLESLRSLLEDLAPLLRIGPRDCWQLFRESQASLVRRVNQNPDLGIRAAADLKLYRRMFAALTTARKQALREQGHLDHVAVALERQQLVCLRLVLARQMAGGLRGTRLERALERQAGAVRRVRERYQCVWLRHNKRPNIEVSLAVFDEVAGSLRKMQPQRPVAWRGFVSLDLGRAYDVCDANVSGMPLAPARVNAVPFRFAGLDRTHASLSNGRVITLPFAETRVRDVHLLCAGFYLPLDARARDPLLEVRLLHRGRCVFTGQLQVIRHICDWFAPRGESMWAGGGFQYVDSARVAFGLSAGAGHGVFHVKGFRTGGRLADTVELRALPLPAEPRAGVALFAATLETDRSVPL